MINNRQQSGRRRGRGGQNGPRQQNGRPEMGNRIDNRARGNAPQLLEKYKTLARDAQQSGDRVLAEYYFQFADHYFRVLAESRARYEEANPNRPRQEYGDSENEGFDGEGNDGDSDDAFDAPVQQTRESRPPQNRQDNRTDNRSEQQPRQYRDDRPQRNDQNRDDRPRDDRPRDDRPRNDQGRDDRPVRQDSRQDREPRLERSTEDRPPRQDRYQRDDRPRDTPPRDAQPREDRPREDRPRNDRPRQARPRDDEPRRSPAPRAQANGNGASYDDDDMGNALPFDALPPAIGVSTMEPVMGVEGEPVAVPKKRGRPKKVVTEAVGEE